MRMLKALKNCIRFVELPTTTLQLTTRNQSEVSRLLPVMPRD